MQNPFSLENKTILITGPSSGIGRQCAIATSQTGADLILVDMNEEKLEETYNLVEKGNHLKFAQDITEYDNLNGVVKQAVEKLGKISGFIHSAGIEATLPLRNMKPSNFEKFFSVNVISGFEFAKILSNKKYLDQNGSSFVFISSVMGITGQAGKVGYCSSKGSLIAGCKAMALELAAQKIRVNCVLPGVVKTGMSKRLFETISQDSKDSIINMHPLGLGEPEDVANACVFLLSDASRWITGTNLIIDGGYTAS